MTVRGPQIAKLISEIEYSPNLLTLLCRWIQQTWQTQLRFSLGYHPFDCANCLIPCFCNFSMFPVIDAHLLQKIITIIMVITLLIQRIILLLLMGSAAALLNSIAALCFISFVVLHYFCTNKRYNNSNKYEATG